MNETREDLNLQQLSNVGTDANTGIPNAEELVDENPRGDESNANKPSAESACGNSGVIVVVDDGAHLNIRRILHRRVTKSSARIHRGTLTTTIKAASTLSSP